MHTECIVYNVDLAVKKNLAEGLTLFQISVFDLKCVVIEFFVCFIIMGRWILLEKESRQFFCFYQGYDLRLGRLVVVI